MTQKPHLPERSFVHPSSPSYFYSWTMGALSFVFVGKILSTYGWKGPFFVNGILMLLMSPLIYKYMPLDSDDPTTKKVVLVDSKNSSQSGDDVVATVCPTSWWKEVTSWKVMSLLGCLLLRDGGMYLVLSSYSLWLEEDWDFEAEEAGTASLVISLGEATAVVAMSLLSDRIGLERNMLGVTLLIVLTSLGIGAFEGSSLYASLGFLGLGFVCFEWGAILTIAITGSSVEAR